MCGQIACHRLSCTRDKAFKAQLRKGYLGVSFAHENGTVLADKAVERCSRRILRQVRLREQRLGLEGLGVGEQGQEDVGWFRAVSPLESLDDRCPAARMTS